MRKTMVYIKKKIIWIIKLTKLKDKSSNDEDLVLLENYISTLPLNKELLIALFNLLERYPNFNFGEPGRVIHLMERYENNIYAPLLFDSLKRKPTKYTLGCLIDI